MKDTITENTFISEMSKKDHGFSREGAKVLFEHLIQFEEDCETDIKFDPIAFRCEYDEYKNLKEVQDNIKIIVLVRDVPEILASFIKHSQKESTSFVNQFEAKTIEEKCDMLMNQEGQIVKELIGITHLLDHQPKEMYHIVEYNDLCDDPKQTIEGIYDFLGIYRFNHRYNNLDQFYVNGMKYDDNIVGQNLHTIQTNSINSNNYNEFKENVNDILPKSIIEKYNNLNFWKVK